MLAVRPQGEAGDGTRCWVSLRSADASFQKVRRARGTAAQCLQMPLHSSQGCAAGAGSAPPRARSPAWRAGRMLRPASAPPVLFPSLPAPPVQLWGKYSSRSGRVELLLPGQEVCVPQGQDQSGLFAISV